jgi:hypothetical protein
MTGRAGDLVGAVLAAERRAILDGAYDRLSGLAVEKAALADRLAQLSAGQRAAFVRGLARNARLLQAAMAGLRGAARPTKAPGFCHYGPDGSRAEAMATAQLTRRM